MKPYKLKWIRRDRTWMILKLIERKYVTIGYTDNLAKTMRHISNGMFHFIMH